jgi:hypothetical protein
MLAVVDVALATRNRTCFTRALTNLAEQTIAHRLAIHLMDGNDDDRVAAFLATRTWPFCSIAHHRDRDVVPNVEKRAWPRLYNYLFARGRAPTVTYWSDDLVIHERDGFERAVRRFAKPRTGAVVFAQKNDDERAFTLATRPFGLSIHFGLLRRCALDDAGGLHEGYRFWFADDDLTLSIRRAGYEVATLPRVRVHNLRAGNWCHPDVADHDDYLLFRKRWGSQSWWRHDTDK